MPEKTAAPNGQEPAQHHKETRADLFPWIANSLVLLISLVVILGAFHGYSRRIDELTLNESRFLTTEWHLLQEIQAETEQQLLAKDREIAELERRYLELMRGQAGGSEVLAVEAQIRAAEAERAALLDRRLQLEPRQASTDPTDTAAPATTERARPSQALTGILYQQLAELELRISQSQEELAAHRQHDQAMRAELTAAISSIEARQGQLADTPGLSLDQLATWSIVRGLANTAEVAAEYPDLLPAIDAYLQAVRESERRAGQLAAYQASLNRLRALERILSE